MPIGTVREWFAAVKSHAHADIQAALPMFQRSVDSLGQTALMKAVLEKDFFLVKILVRYEHSITTKVGLTALSIAALENDFELCKFLGVYEKDILLPNKRTSLMLAADSGCTESVNALLAFYDNERDEFKWSALDYAVSKSHTDCVHSLLKANVWTIQDLTIAFNVAKRASLTAMMDLLYGYIRQGAVAECTQCSVLRSALKTALGEIGSLTAGLSSLVIHKEITSSTPASSIKETVPKADYVALLEKYNWVLAELESHKVNIQRMKSQRTSESSKEERSQPESRTSIPPKPPASSTTLHTGLAQSTYSINLQDTVADNERFSLYSILDPTIIITDQTILEDATSPLLTQKVNFPLKKAEINAGDDEDDIPLDEAGNTPLMHAVISQKMNLVKAYMFAQATRQNATGTTALMIAISTGFIEAARFLADLEAGKQDVHGQTALMIAASMDNTELVKMLMNEEAKKISANGKTALMIAIEAGAADSAKLLAPLEAGMQDSSGRKAIHYAAWNDMDEILRVLLPVEKGAKDSFGYTALMIASLKGHVNSTRILKSHEGQITKPDGWTALMAAATLNNFTIVVELLDIEAGMQTNATSCRGAGYTALMAAAEVGSLDSLRILIPKELHIRQSNGKSALEWALYPNPKGDRVNKNKCYILLKKYLEVSTK